MMFFNRNRSQILLSVALVRCRRLQDLSVIRSILQALPYAAYCMYQVVGLHLNAQQEIRVKLLVDANC